VRFLADANLERVLVNWLREQGHDVAWAADLPPSTPDDEVLLIAEREGRVVVPNDLDFGELVFRQRRSSIGVVLLRYRTTSSAELVSLFGAHWSQIESRLPGSFVVATRSRLRVRPLV
jgi:predicted nuclease of predicted toxin-antitoxin system